MRASSCCFLFLLGGCYVSHSREVIGEPEDAGPTACVEAPYDSCVAPDDPIFSRDADGVHALHWWTGGGCVPVSIDPAAIPWRESITSSLAAWAARGCSPFCPTPISDTYVADPLDCERRLHFALATTTGVSSRLQMVRGELQEAEIFLGEPTRDIDILGMIGTAHGLGQSLPPTPLIEGDSILPEAHAAACVLYGADPHCD